jgi:hypothetical protein
VYLLLGLAFLAMAGCVTGESAAYKQHVGTFLRPNSASNDDVASAFGLDDGGVPAVATANASER